jgi:hypothetical protein
VTAPPPPPCMASAPCAYRIEGPQHILLEVMHGSRNNERVEWPPKVKLH